MKHKIVLVSFPFDDLASTKVRPAVCLTEPLGSHRHVILAFITSQTPDEPLPSDVAVADTHANFAATGLHVKSVIRLHRLMTASTAIIRRELGVLPPALIAEVRDKLQILFCS